MKDDGKRRKADKPRRNLGNLPEDLPRIEKVIEPDSTACLCGCGEMERIQAVLAATYAVVVFSIIIQGLSMKPLIKRYNFRGAGKEPEA